MSVARVHTNVCDVGACVSACVCIFKMTQEVVVLTNRMAYGALLFGNHE